MAEKQASVGIPESTLKILKRIKKETGVPIKILLIKAVGNLAAEYKANGGS